MVTVSFHGIYWIKCIQLFPFHARLKIVFIDVIHKNQIKKQPLKEGLSCELNVKLLDRVHQIIFLLQASPTRIPVWGQKCIFSLLFALQNTVFLSCMPPIPCKGYELNAANPAGNKPLRAAQHMWSQSSEPAAVTSEEQRFPISWPSLLQLRKSLPFSFLPFLSLLFT